MTVYKVEIDKSVLEDNPMTIRQNIVMAVLAVVMVCVPAGVRAQDTVRQERMQKIDYVATEMAAMPKYIIHINNPGGCFFPYYPNTEYVFSYWRPWLFFPKTLSDSYNEYKAQADWWLMPQMVDIEEVDGQKMIKDKEIDEESTVK